MRLTVMTFNVRGSFHEDGDNAWDKRRDLNLATLRRYTPDLFGFQEAQSGNLAAYEALTAYDSERGPISIRMTERREHLPLYWLRAKFAKVDSGGFYLSETPEVWSLCWGSTLVRAITWVRLRELTSDEELIVLNAHFPHEQESDSARIESARLIVERLKAINREHLPVIVTGDFNALPTGEAYRVFADAGYVDAFTAAGLSDAVNTFHGFQGSDFSHQGIRIDWILVHPAARTLTVHRCVTITDAEPPIYPSDHYPVMAEVELA